MIYQGPTKFHLKVAQKNSLTLKIFQKLLLNTCCIQLIIKHQLNYTLYQHIDQNRLCTKIKHLKKSKGKTNYFVKF